MKREDNLSSLLKTFVRGSFIVFIGVFISKLLTYLYKVIVAREFGQEVYGVFSLAVMVAGFFVNFFSLGLQSGLLRYISLYRGQNKPEKIKSIIFFSAVITFFSSIFAAALLFFSSNFISVSIFHAPELTVFLQWFAVFLPIFIFSGFFHVITLAYEKIGWFSFIGNILSPLIQLVFLIVFIVIGVKSEGIPISYNIGFLAVFLCAFLVSKYTIKGIFKNSKKNLKDKKTIRKELILYSLPIIFLGLINSIFSMVDTFSIGYFKTTAEVGLYNAALPISLFLLIAPVLFLQLFLPVITKEYSKKNFKLITNLSKQLGKWIFIFNLPILIIMLLFPGAVINLLFGSEYLPAENALRFLSIGVFFYSLLQISENLLSMIGKSKRILLNLAIATGVNILLNILLIPKYGISGAAFATMIGYLVWGGLSLFTAKYYTSIIPFRREIIKIFLVSIIPTLALFYIRNKINLTFFNILVLGIIFVLVYLGLILLTHSLDKNDLIILSSIKKKILLRKK
jgi:O-antigen/teichoic acid export membrane protein